MKLIKWLSFSTLIGGYLFGLTDRYLAGDYYSVVIAAPFFLLTCIIFDYE